MKKLKTLALGILLGLCQVAVVKAEVVYEGEEDFEYFCPPPEGSAPGFGICEEYECVSADEGEAPGLQCETYSSDTGGEDEGVDDEQPRRVEKGVQKADLAKYLFALEMTIKLPTKDFNFSVNDQYVDLVIDAEVTRRKKSDMNNAYAQKIEIRKRFKVQNGQVFKLDFVKLLGSEGRPMIYFHNVYAQTLLKLPDGKIKVFDVEPVTIKNPDTTGSGSVRAYADLIFKEE